jgi:hypothetical protein
MFFGFKEKINFGRSLYQKSIVLMGNLVWGEARKSVQRALGKRALGKRALGKRALGKRALKCSGMKKRTESGVG